MRKIYFRRLEHPGQVAAIKAALLLPLDEEQSLRAELLCDPVPNLSWVLQEVPAQIWS